MTDDASSNGATLKEKVRQLEDRFKEIKETVDDVQDGLYGVKGDYISRLEFGKSIDRITELEKNMSALRERLTIYNLAQASFTTIIGAIAVIVGVLFK